LNERNFQQISDEYGIDFGSLQSLQQEAAAYSGQVVKYCQLSGHPILGEILSKLRTKFIYSSKTELIHLLSLPSMNQ
jgi:hypothetical protein